MREMAWLQFIKSEVMNNTDPLADSSKRKKTDLDTLINKKVKPLQDQEDVWGVVDPTLALGVGEGEVDMVEEEGGTRGDVVEEEGDRGDDVDEGEHQSEEETMEGDE